MAQSESKNSPGWLAATAWSAAVISVIVLVLWLSPTAREVAGETALMLFQILTAPFILEASLALLGLCIVLVINQYRQQRDGDEWVYLQKHEPPAAQPADAAAPPHRHDAVIWLEKPGDFDENEAVLEVVEGYLDLGLLDEAMREIESLPATRLQSGRADELLIRALAMSGRPAEATRIMAGRAATHPDRRPRLAAAAIAVASWLQETGGAAGSIDEWLRLSRDLDPRAIESLPHGHPLRS